MQSSFSSKLWLLESKFYFWLECFCKAELSVTHFRKWNPVSNIIDLARLQYSFPSVTVFAPEVVSPTYRSSKNFSTNLGYADTYFKKWWRMVPFNKKGRLVIPEKILKTFDAQQKLQHLGTPP